MRARIQEQDGLLRFANPPISSVFQNDSMLSITLSFAYDAVFWANNGGKVIVRVLRENSEKPQIGNEFGFDSIPDDLFTEFETSLPEIEITLGRGLNPSSLRNGNLIPYDYELPPQQIDVMTSAENLSTQQKLINKILDDQDPALLGLNDRSFDSDIEEDEFFEKDGTIYETVSGEFESRYAIETKVIPINTLNFLTYTIYEFTYMIEDKPISKSRVNIASYISRLLEERGINESLPKDETSTNRSFANISSISISPLKYSAFSSSYGLNRQEFYYRSEEIKVLPNVMSKLLGSSIVGPSKIIFIPFYIDYQNRQIKLTKNLSLIPGASELQILLDPKPSGLPVTRISQSINSNEISVSLPSSLRNGVEYSISLIVRTRRQIEYRSSNFLIYKHFSNPLNTVSIRTLEAALQEDGNRQIIAKLNFTDASLSNNDFRCILEKVSLENGTQERNDRTTSIEANSLGEFIFDVTDQGNFAYSVSLLKTIGSASTFETGNRKTIISNNITTSQPIISNVKISPAINRWNIISWEIFGSIDQIDHFQVYGKWAGVERLLGCSFRSLKYIDTKLWKKAGTVTYRIVPIYLDFSNGQDIEISIRLDNTLPLLVKDNFELGQIALQEPVEKYFAPPETSTSPTTRNSRFAVAPGSSSSITNAFSSRAPLASIPREIVPIDEIPKDNDFLSNGNFEILINKNDPQRSDPQLEGDFSTSSRSRSSSSSTKTKNLQRVSGKVNIPIVRKS